MALIKERTLLNGSTGNYWKVTHFSVDKVGMHLDCAIELFQDEAHKNAAPLQFFKAYKFPVTKQEIAGDITALCYTKIKASAALTHLDPMGTGEQVPVDIDLAGAVDG